MICRVSGVVSSLSSFSPNCQKITWGHHGDVRCPPVTPPMLFFDNLVKKTSLVFSPYCQNNNMGVSWGASDAPNDGGIMGVSDTPHDTPTLFFDNLVKKLDKQSL